MDEWVVLLRGGRHAKDALAMDVAKLRLPTTPYGVSVTVSLESSAGHDAMCSQVAR